MSKSIQSVVEEKEKFISKIFHIFHEPLLSDNVPYVIIEREVDRFLSKQKALHIEQLKELQVYITDPDINARRDVINKIDELIHNDTL